MLFLSLLLLLQTLPQRFFLRPSLHDAMAEVRRALEHIQHHPFHRRNIGAVVERRSFSRCGQQLVDKERARWIP